MEIVLLFDPDRKEEIQKILDAEPYCRQGYSIKEPKTLGFDEEGLYLYFKGDEKIVKDFQKEVGGLAWKTKKEREVLKKIKEEESSANVGMGFIFGK